MDSCVEKVTVRSQTHGLEKKEKIVSSFLENNLSGTDVNVHPVVCIIYWIPLLKKKKHSFEFKSLPVSVTLERLTIFLLYFL